MNTKLLIDAIVHQTTVLIAQLSTAAGVRAPLAHVADEVFVSLARAIEDQGVGRKVVADMFGLALRTYQRKVQRLEESATEREHTLWEAILEFLTQNGSTPKAAVLARFSRDDPRAVGAVLKDLVQSGLVFGSGRAEVTLYRVTTEAEREALSAAGERSVLSMMLWAAVFREPGLRLSDLKARFRASPTEIQASLDGLLRAGHLKSDGTDDAPFSPTSLVIPVGAEAGWETAVFDHYQAMVGAMIHKLRQGATHSGATDTAGGSTFHFGVHETHPLRDEVLGSLGRVRREMTDLFERVAEHNRAFAVQEAERTRVTFYFGQSAIAPDGVDPQAQADEEQQ